MSSSGYEAKYDNLKDMISRDQYFLTCDKSLQTFVKEKGKLSLKEMKKLLMIITEVSL